jgi:hypothetical protein
MHRQKQNKLSGRRHTELKVVVDIDCAAGQDLFATTYGVGIAGVPELLWPQLHTRTGAGQTPQGLVVVAMVELQDQLRHIVTFKTKFLQIK